MESETAEEREERLRKSATSLWEALGVGSGTSGYTVGIDAVAGELVVYCEKKKLESEVPLIWEGFPIRRRTVGKIRPAMV